MRMTPVLIAATTILLTACSGVGEQHATVLPSKTGRDTYSVNGLVFVPEVKTDITKPYMEKGMAGACPHGFIYDQYREAVNKVTIAGTWVQWSGIVQCKKARDK